MTESCSVKSRKSSLKIHGRALGMFEGMCSLRTKSHARRCLVFLVVLLLSQAALGAQPVPVIFDTDMGNDVDDALALAMLHAFQSRGEAKILAVTITKDNPWSAPFVDLVNTFYGRGGIPIGTVVNGKTPEGNPMIEEPASRRRPDRSFVYPHRITNGRQAPEAVSLLRKVLTAQPDGSVIIIQVGFSTNLARLLASTADSNSPLAGRDLVSRKVRLLSAMAGNFQTGAAEFNVQMDVPAAQKLFNEWPTPIVVSGFEIGSALLFPASSIERDFAYVADHPIAEAYRNYMKMPYDRPSWDLTATLYAVRSDRNYFSLSVPGRISALEGGRTQFVPDGNGKHRYLIINGEQKSRALEAMIMLASQPPDQKGQMIAAEH